jgi:glycosidase
MRYTVVLALILAQGCCGRGAPVWYPMEPLDVSGGTVTLDLLDFIGDERPEKLRFEVDADDVLVATLDGSRLDVTAQPDFEGEATLRLLAEDSCGNEVTTEITVTTLGTTATSGIDGSCLTTFTWQSQGDPAAVAVAGDFNDWSAEADRLEQVDGVWTLSLALPPGAYPYKIVEIGDGSFGATETWSCDPAADYIQCDPGYKQPWDIGFAHDCSPGGQSCNSMVIVEPCDGPLLEVSALDIDRSAGTVSLVASVSPGPAHLDTVGVTLDDEPVDATVTDGELSLALSGLAQGRHTLRVQATDVAGGVADPLYIPFWIDERTWEDQILYFAFLDRMHDGDSSLPAGEGATALGGDYVGGDVQGLIDLLPYLDDLGVTALWLSNLQDNAEGPWDGDCGLTYAGYHAYWPDEARTVDEHFGDDALVHELVDQAHARGMRVIVDLVANHVHTDHPYYSEHPDWFTPYDGCKDVVNGQMGFDRIPETCWFSPYLPDLDYTQPGPLQAVLEDARWWAETYEFDGFRVDAVKHMSHAVSWNLGSLARTRFEHSDVGGDELFWMVGETFDNGDRIASYISEEQLDGQFDFPMYYALRNTFAYGQGEVGDLLAAYESSRSLFGDAPMSTFLGNHDVNRFVTDAVTGWQDICDGGQIRVASPPVDAWPYERLELGWSFLFTMPGIPLVYYGDELGLPGNPDPDNRQPLSWHAADLGAVSDVEDLAAQVSAHQAGVLRHLRALAHARQEHAALREGSWVEWWREPDLFAYARHDEAGQDHALVILNRSGAPRTLSNGLAFASLPQGRYVDVLTGQTADTTGDNLTVQVDPGASRVYVWQP